MLNTAMRLILLVCLASGLCMGLVGCKKSLILTELVHDQENGQIDPSAEPIQKEVLGAPVDKNRVSNIDSNDKSDKTKKAKRNFDENQQSQQQTQKQEHKKSSNNKKATTGDEAGDGSEKALSGQDGNESASQDDDDNNKNDKDKEANAGSGGQGETYDASGKSTALPQNVHTVAATGQYALITQMLAGKGALVAADEEWLSQVKKSGAFKGEGLGSVSVAWNGDGTKKGSGSVDKLLKLKPDCLLVQSTAKSGLSKQDLAKLKKSGVNIVTMPKLGTVDTPDSNITSAVEIVGELLKDAGTTVQYDASAMADTYKSMHKTTINTCVKANGGYTYKVYSGSTFGFIYQGTDKDGKSTTKLSTTRLTTSFIDSWLSLKRKTVSSSRSFGGAKMDYLSSTSDKLDCSEGLGLSATATSKNFLLLDYYLQCSGVQDNALEGAKPVLYSDSLGYSRPYAVVAGASDNITELDRIVVKRSAPSSLWYTPTGAANDWITVGDDSYPGIIVRDSKIAKKVLASAKKEKGYYNVGQRYYVYTMPKGVAGNWADGTVESYLTCAWAYDLFRGDNNLTNASTYVSSFYETFYRCKDYTDAISGYGKQGIAQAKCPRGASSDDE